MDKDANKRIMDGPITSSMRTDTPSQESIEALRERYALHNKMTARKPLESFDSVLAGVGRDEHEPGQDASSNTQDGEPTSAPSSASPSVEAQATPKGVDTFESVPKGELGRRSPLPSGRHPDTPRPGGGKGKVIIKA